MKKVAHSLKTKTKERIFLDAKKYQGLCSCCKFTLACTYNRNPEHPILQCEEFDGIIFVPLRTSIPKKTSLTNLQKDPFPSDEAFQQHSGLCTNCEERTTCTYPKPEGGVWHCEEYR